MKTIAADPFAATSRIHDASPAAERPRFARVSSAASAGEDQSAEAGKNACDGSWPRLESYDFHSAILPDDRRICIYLPPQYAADPARRFPVFYLHDGQNLFDPRLSYIPGQTWRAGTTADELNQANQIAPLILVGVANTGLRRMPEYTPTRDRKMGGGDGDLYGRLLVEELIPFIDQTYRTCSGAENTGLGGSSLGGLISLYLGLEYPEVFGRLAVMSPSIWWDQRSILAFVQQFAPGAAQRPRIWLDIGTAEGQHHVRDTELLNRVLQREGWQPGMDVKFLEVTGGLHSEAAWADRFDQVLRFLFPAS